MTVSGAVLVGIELDTTSCRREGGGLSGRSPVASAGICPYTPHTLQPPRSPTSQPVTGVADWLAAISSQQMATMRHPCGTSQGLASGELIPAHTPPWGLTLGSGQTHTHSAKAVQAGWVTEVEAAASAPYGRTPSPPLPPTHPNYLVDELFFHLKPKGRIQMIIGFIYLFNVYRSSQCRLISHI